MIHFEKQAKMCYFNLNDHTYKIWDILLFLLTERWQNIALNNNTVSSSGKKSCAQNLSYAIKLLCVTQTSGTEDSINMPQKYELWPNYYSCLW